MLGKLGCSPSGRAQQPTSRLRETIGKLGIRTDPAFQGPREQILAEPVPGLDVRGKTEGPMKQISLIDRLEQDLQRAQQKAAQLRAKGKDCMEEQQRIARTSVALELLR